jgi:HAD superfamily hydrolase (TIGR01509 family)
MSSFRAVLLDVDGTLIDSNDPHAQCWCDVLAEFDRPVAFERVRALIGKGGDKLLAETVGISADEKLGQAISKRREQRFLSDYLPKLKPFSKSAELVHRMRDDGLKIAIATSAKKKEMNALLEIIGIRADIDAATSADDAEESKPDPDIIHAALDKLRVTPAETVLLGDTPYDIQAASDADVGTIAVLSGGWSIEELNGAIAVYRDCEHLLEQFDSSPLGG